MPVEELRPPRQYSGSSNFVVYSPGGGSFAYYPSGRMAAAMERMGTGFYCYFYADNAAGTTLAAIDPLGCGFVAFPNGKPRLTSQKHGGTFCGEDGTILRSWTTLKPLRPNDPIRFDVSSELSFSFQSRQLVTARLTCQGLSEEYELGVVQKMATDSYLSKSVGVIRMGPERGKQILDVDKCREAADANRARREAMGVMVDVPVAKKTNITPDDMQKHPQLRPIVDSTDALHASVARGEWHVDVFVSKSKLAATLGDSMPTLRLGDSLRGDRHSQTLAGMPALQPDILQSMLQPSDTGSAPLPLSQSIKTASGRFRPEHGSHYKRLSRRLKLLKAKTFDAYVKQDAPAGTLVVVCCLAGYVPQCRRVEPVLEGLNGELWEKATRAAGPEGEPAPEFVLAKFEMSESRMLRDRHNINTLPMYLMYYEGRLAYASNTLNGYGTSKEDMLAQARDTLLAAQRGSFLPDDFRFGHTSDNTVAAFDKTLGSTAPILGAS